LYNPVTASILGMRHRDHGSVMDLIGGKDV
jgi:hypothetical protein